MNNPQKLVFFLAISFLPVTLFGQNNGAMTLFPDGRPEVYFKFAIHFYADLRKASNIVSVDNRKGDTIYAYANTQEFANFKNLGWPFEVLTTPSLLVKPSMRGDIKGIQAWNSYPTYPAYVQMMQYYAAHYPYLCKLDTIGTSVKGRLLLFLEISNRPGMNEAKPEFMYSSTIHGDEPTGYVLMLRLIDYLLGNFGKDSLVTDLVNRTHIWINPLANPDGTYYGGDSTLQGAGRVNFNGYDLNRNFPDPIYGPYPGGTRQPETQAMMNFMQQHRFVMSANFHTGAEVVNYPWDSWESAQKTHADDAWFQLIGKQFADTAHKFGPSAYFTDPVGDGYINGGDWYVISGGRQDYITYFLNGREVTIELSSTFIPSGSDLPIYWEACYRSFLHYMEQATYGIHGFVSDNNTDKPLRAQIEIPGHDKDNSEVYSDSIHGYYTRLIAQGSYNLFFSAPGYYSRLMKGKNVINYQATNLNVKLLSSAGNQYPPILKDQFGHVKDTVMIDLLPDSSQQGCFHISDPEGQLAWISSAQSISGKISPVLSFCDTCLTFIPDSGFTGNDTLRMVLCDNANPALCDTVWVIARVNNPGLVPEYVNLQSLRIYPNPFADHININLTTIPGNNCYISLIDITGREYFLKKIDAKNMSINAGSLPNGIYYLLFYSGNAIIHSYHIIKIE